MKYYKTRKEAKKEANKHDKIYYVSSKGFAIVKVSPSYKISMGFDRKKIDWSWSILIASFSFIIIGFTLSEPTNLGRWHPLLGDAMILVSIWYIGKR